MIHYNIIFKKMKSILKKNIPRESETQKIAQDFYEEYLKNVSGGTVFFEGGLGSGKTVMIKSLLRKAGISENIPSPTYTIVQEYQTPSQNFAHFDFYRLSDPSEFFARGMEEIAENPQIIKLVEWPGKLSPSIKKIFTPPRYTIQINHGIGVGMRTLKILSSEND